MRIVVDTNVLISAFIATGTCKDILEYAVETHEVIISPYILKELKEKLIEKLVFSTKDYRDIRDILQQHLTVVTEKKSLQSFPDKDDIPILNLCLTVKADILVTGDKELLKLRLIGNTKIIPPSEFWKIEKGIRSR
ncbi:MAG: putative toxin-antitoxin system toxin component, PIN family [Nitrospirae bacterium]|nr:putative toxin-antitoxin system toxin component, PIN family [Nitrospirota bacterium]